MSLRVKLNELIKSRNGDMVSYSECDQIRIKVNQETGENYKQSNMERRLRISESPNVMTMLNKKGHIIGYAWKHKDFEKKEEKQRNLFT